MVTYEACAAHRLVTTNWNSSTQNKQQQLEGVVALHVQWSVVMHGRGEASCTDPHGLFQGWYSLVQIMLSHLGHMSTFNFFVSNFLAFLGYTLKTIRLYMGY